jgi:hypothetical protein
LSPFGHYETCISKTDWDSYTSFPPSRKAPHPTTNSKEVNKALSLLKGRVDLTNAETLEIATHKNQQRGTRTAGDTKAGSEGRIEEENGEKGFVKQPDYSCLQIHVSSSKIRMARWTRSGPGIPKQKDVMGGCSATEVC